MAEDMPKKRMPKFKIGDDEAEDLKAISAVTGLLAGKPEVASEIADIFVEVEMEKERELARKISEKLSEHLPELKDKITASYELWSPLFYRYIPAYRYVPPRYWYPEPRRYVQTADRYKGPAPQE